MNLEFPPGGHADYLSAIAQYKARSLTRGIAFATAFRAALATISAFPRSCSADARGVRKKSLPRFKKNVVVYRLEDDGVIEIIAVTHERRDEYWKDRL